MQPDKTPEDKLFDSGSNPGLKTTSSGRIAEKPEILEMPLPAGYRFFLRGLDTPVQNQVFILQKARQIIGRVDADITIDEPSISRKHAAIEIYDIDFAYIKDLASTNGTFLNGEMINAAKLRTGDTLAIGDCRMQFLVESENPAK